MGILNSSNDLLAKMKANDEKAQNDLFSMSEDSTLPLVFRNMAKRGFDYIVALEAEAEIHNDRIADLERQLQEAQRWKRAVDNELVCCHLGTTDSMEPNVAIASIGRWHYDLGVSGVCEPDSTAGEPE